MEPFSSMPPEASQRAPESVQPLEQRKPGAGAFGLIILVGVLLVPAFLIGNGNNNAAEIAAGLFIGGSLVMYFAPAIVAMVFRHPSQTGITVLNFFLGWTLVGWVAALVWAFTLPKAQASEPQATDAGMRACPYCAEPIRAAAIKCKHCGSSVAVTA